MHIENQAADTLLERGLPLPVRAPLFFRLLGLQPKCYQPTLGNKIRINKLYLKMGIDPKQLEEISLVAADQLLVKNGYRLCKIIAIGMCKGWLWPLLFAPAIAVWLKWKLNPKYACAIAYVMISQSGTADFMDTTRLIAQMQILAPSLGQSPQRS